ncbi:Transcriptional regulator, AcrR family, partial [hydrothermal vent metagenome]
MNQKTDKRQAILDGTIQLIAEKGFHGTAMSQVAKVAGVSTGIIYHYFASKDDLIQAVYTDTKKALFANLLINDDPQLPMQDRVQQIWHNMYRYCLENPEQTAFLEQFEHSPYASEIDAYQDDPLLQLVEGGIDVGIFKNLPLMVLYDLSLGIAFATAKHHINKTYIF